MTTLPGERYHHILLDLSLGPQTDVDYAPAAIRLKTGHRVRPHFFIWQRSRCRPLIAQLHRKFVQSTTTLHIRFDVTNPPTPFFTDACHNYHHGLMFHLNLYLTRAQYFHYPIHHRAVFFPPPKRPPNRNVRGVIKSNFMSRFAQIIVLICSLLMRADYGVSSIVVLSKLPITFFIDFNRKACKYIGPKGFEVNNDPLPYLRNEDDPGPSTQIWYLPEHKASSKCPGSPFEVKRGLFIHPPPSPR